MSLRAHALNSLSALPPTSSILDYRGRLPALEPLKNAAVRGLCPATRCPLPTKSKQPCVRIAPEAHAQTLLTKRKLALAVLEHLQGFDAYLTGAVLNGAATEDSPICLEVFTDDVKSLLAVLMDEGFDLEALDPQASAFGRADESIGFVLPWQGNMEAVRIDVLAPQLARSNPARGKKDDYQTEWEAEGRISSENLRKFLENRANS